MSEGFVGPLWGILSGTLSGVFTPIVLKWLENDIRNIAEAPSFDRDGNMCVHLRLVNNSPGPQMLTRLDVIYPDHAILIEKERMAPYGGEQTTFTQLRVESGSLLERFFLFAPLPKGSVPITDVYVTRFKTKAYVVLATTWLRHILRAMALPIMVPNTPPRIPQSIVIIVLT